MSNSNIIKKFKVNPYINEKNQSIFAGIGVAVVTPFTENNEIDKEAIYKLSDHLFFNGMSYVVVQGTTGESSVLNDQEKNLVNSLFTDAFKGRIPLILGMSSNDTRYICNLISNYDFSGFEAIMSVCPYYNKPSQDGIFQHFSKISDLSPLPLILYNVPGRTSCDISNNTIIKLSEYSKNIIGIKEASGDINNCMELVSRCPDDFMIISGDDKMTYPIMSLGGVGVISVQAMAFPELFTTMVNACLQSKYDIAKKKHYELLKSVDLFYIDGNPAGIKEALFFKNICNSSQVRLPLVKMDKDNAKKMHLLL